MLNMKDDAIRERDGLYGHVINYFHITFDFFSISDLDHKPLCLE
jgi:hypothetical protein